MNNHRQSLPILITGWMLLVASSAFSATKTGIGLQPFQAEYRISRGNMVIGKVVSSLELTEENNYTYKAVTTPLGLLAVFKKDTITEISTGGISGTKVIPATYYFKHDRKKKPRHTELTFDWIGNKVTNHVVNKQWTLTIPTGTQDKFSKQLSMMLAMNHNIEKMEYQVADRKRLKRYRFDIQGQEQIDAAGDVFDTIRLERSKQERQPEASFWVAPELNYLPVKVEKREKSGTFTMELHSITFGNPEPKMSAGLIR